LKTRCNKDDGTHKPKERLKTKTQDNAVLQAWLALECLQSQTNLAKTPNHPLSTPDQFTAQGSISF
jgi:hypothetical protein